MKTRGSHSLVTKKHHNIQKPTWMDADLDENRCEKITFQRCAEEAPKLERQKAPCLGTRFWKTILIMSAAFSLLNCPLVTIFVSK